MDTANGAASRRPIQRRLQKNDKATGLVFFARRPAQPVPHQFPRARFCSASQAKCHMKRALQ